MWITFYNDKLWWCFGKEEFSGAGYKEKYRKTLYGWSSKNVKGEDLFVDNLSGDLLKTQGYQSTICNVKAFDYTVRKINAIELEEIKVLNQQLENLTLTVGKMINKLNATDFEILIDLIFRQSGYKRTNVIGGPQKTKDIELLEPLTNSRIIIQVKSRSTLKTFNDYKLRFENYNGYGKFYFVTHKPSKDLLSEITNNNRKVNTNLEIWDCKKVSQMVIENGLIEWIKNKVK